jgi:hypothetical protein
MEIELNKDTLIKLISSTICIEAKLANTLTKLGWYKHELLNSDNTIIRFNWSKPALEKLEIHELINIFNKIYKIDNMMEVNKPIDKVTTERLDMALRMCGHNLDYNLIDNIIDLVELIGEKGGNVTMSDIISLKFQWDTF